MVNKVPSLYEKAGMTLQSNIARNLLIKRLADGVFHSGEALGEELGLSRAAISNHVKALTELGLSIFSVTGKGYKLEKPLDLLNVEQIKQGVLNKQFDNVEVLNVIDSTNEYVKNQIPELSRLGDQRNGYVCLAEAQTAGRGRHGRQWVSPYGASLYMSMYWQFAGGYQAIGGLSLVIGVSIANALKRQQIQGVQLKWPNDIYLQGKKLAGVLIEVEGQMGAHCDCVIGIGLNINLPDEQKDIDQPWIDLTSATGANIDRNALAVDIITELFKQITLFEFSGLEPFIEDWKGLDYFRNQAIKLIVGQNELTGICRGIDETGALLLESNGHVKAFYGGEISVRPA